jgi:hypothetical protein
VNGAIFGMFELYRGRISAQSLGVEAAKGVAFGIHWAARSTYINNIISRGRLGLVHRI